MISWRMRCVSCIRNRVQISDPSCGLLHRHSENIYSACILKDGSEILLGLENGLACFEMKKKQILWTKTLRTIRVIERIARAKSYVSFKILDLNPDRVLSFSHDRLHFQLPLANQKSGIESMYPQKVAFNPDIRAGPRRCKPSGSNSP